MTLRQALAGLLLVAGGAAAQLESDEDRALLGELREVFRRGGSWSAQQELEAYLADFPASAEARALAAQAAFARGQLDAARAHLDAIGPESLPRLRAALLAREGRHEDLLRLARSGALRGLLGERLAVEALDALGRRSEALAASARATAAVDDRQLDGHELLELARLLLFQRRFDLANQALVFADAELNGRRGPSAKLVEFDVPLLLGEVYAETRQSSQGGGDPTLAVLNEVLAVDAGHVEALVTKARVYLYGMNGRAAEAALARALSRDPGHPGALLLLARTRLLDRRVGAALALAEQVLARDPRHREALAVRAVALVVGARPGAEAGQQAFATAHPESGALHALLGEVLQSHYRFEESIPALERALVLSPEDERPLPLLAQSLAHVGRETEARAALQEHLRRSPWPYPWRHNMLAVLAELAAATETTSGEAPVLRLRLPPADADVLGGPLADRLRAAERDLSARWGVDLPDEVLVEVFSRQGDFSVRTVGFEGFLALGACFGRVVTLVSPLSELRGHFQWEQTAVHEFAHVVTLALSRQRVPRWLTEGVSVVEEKRAHPAWARELEREVLDARANGLVPPIERLDETFRDGSTVLLGYYLGSLVCELVERDFGFPALRALVAAYGEGLDTPAAVRAALGVDVDELDRRLEVYLEEVVAARAVVRPRWNEDGRARLRRRALDGDSEAWLDLASACLAAGLRTDADAALAAHAAAHGECPAAQRVLAERDVRDGRPDRARERLAEWVAHGQVDADGLLLHARLLDRAGEAHAARETLWRALELYPGDVGEGGAAVELARSIDAAEQPEEWRRLLEHVIAHDERAFEARVQLARTAAEQGDHERAAKLYREALGIDPCRPELRMALAEALSALDRPEEAAEQWRLVLALREEHVPGEAASAHDLPGFVPKGGEATLPDWQARARRALSGASP